MPDVNQAIPAPELKQPRVLEENLADLASRLARTAAEVREHRAVLDRLSHERPTPHLLNASMRSSCEAGTSEAAPDRGTTSAFILTLDGEEYATELAALADWVHHLLLPVYGREISAARPWCQQWHEHPEAVARLHALWLAWQQLTSTDAGRCSPSTWHRDHLDPVLLQLRAPDGPFAACSTDLSRPAHRVLTCPTSATGGGARRPT